MSATAKRNNAVGCSLIVLAAAVFVVLLVMRLRT
jgi:hypothetical protein